MTICILTPAPGHYEIWRPEGDLLAELFGGDLVFRPWNDAGDLTRFDLIMPLFAWGYQDHVDQWSAALDAWEAARLPLANAVPTLRWNTDKHYLADIEASGVAIVPTRFVAHLSEDSLTEARAAFDCADLIVKPPISGGAARTHKVLPGDPVPPDVVGCEMMVQPMMSVIAEEGELSLFYFAGRFSHAIVKRPTPGDFRVQEQFGGESVAIDPPAEAVTLAQASLTTAPAPPLYARVDMVRDDRGQFRLMELELIEPSLFLMRDLEQGALFKSATIDLARSLETAYRSSI